MPHDASVSPTHLSLIISNTIPSFPTHSLHSLPPQIPLIPSASISVIFFFITPPYYFNVGSCFFSSVAIISTADSVLVCPWRKQSYYLTTQALHCYRMSSILSLPPKSILCYILPPINIPIHPEHLPPGIACYPQFPCILCLVPSFKTTTSSK